MIDLSIAQEYMVILTATLGLLGFLEIWPVFCDWLRPVSYITVPMKKIPPVELQEYRMETQNHEVKTFCSVSKIDQRHYQDDDYIAHFEYVAIQAFVNDIKPYITKSYENDLYHPSLKVLKLELRLAVRT